jgi:uncharacterized protein YecE (DUF72 family)
MAGTIRIGVGGWTYEPWRGTFYPGSLPQKQELEYASRQLTSIEINGTYYGSQKPATYKKWHDETPEDFVFALKAPRFAMNRTVLAGAGPTIERFLASGITELKHKLGPINWQFLPTKEFDAGDFEAFLDLLPKKAANLALRHVVEVRHDSFLNPEFLALTRKHQVAIVVAGDSEYPQIADSTAPFVYARIMGTKAKQPLGYAEDALKAWVTRAKAWSTGKKPTGLNYIESKTPPNAPRDVYLYVISGHKVANPAAAVDMIKRLGRKSRE